MAKFLTTRKAVSEIEDLIRHANSRLVLVSPYLRLSEDFKELLQFRNSQDKVTTIIFGKQELNPDELRFLQGLRFVVLKFNKNLHAKCYLNDSKAVITSLNLYEFSMANNKEMGVLIDSVHDNELYRDTLEEVDFIDKTSQRFEFVSQPVIDKKQQGFCIRTGIQIPFDIERPFCDKAYKQWSKYEDHSYPEKFCHFSGDPSNGETSYEKPILKKHWKQAKQVFNI